MKHESAPENEFDGAVFLRSKSYFVKKPFKSIESKHNQYNHMKITL